GAGGRGAAGTPGAGGGTPATGGGGAVAASDYPYCNYGAVPSGTPPAAWNDSPTLTPIGLNPYGKPALTVAGGYILISEGAQGTAQVPQGTQQSILARINDDLKFETSFSFIHLPSWSTGATGSHYIDYLLVGTGLPNDPNAGGDSSWEGSYPDVETTSVAMTDQSQRYDLTHEFNHVLENAYGTVPGPKVSWIQESYNDYLILLTAEHAAGATPGQATPFMLPSNVGYLDALVYQQPFVPIESCGIAVKDGSSVNGPADYFTDITGFRYNDLFPLFVAQRVGQHFFAAVWEQAKTTEQILQTMTRLTDAARVQCMVQEYAARLALGDFQELSASIQRVASAAMYQATASSGGGLRPSDPNQLPRYTGRNNLPIAVSAGATQVIATFTPDATGSNGTPASLRAQLVYRATDGTAVFGPPVSSGAASVTLTKSPRNNVVVLVISNTTLTGYKKATSYGWDPNETFGYAVQIAGGTPAPTNKTYF
ncbi:MAG TPA: DUF6055 domain-containing protein, partial [Polyangia bacterium]|nr:DUF6055 domain-containing protein [Polyangia bacterium]